MLPTLSLALQSTCGHLPEKGPIEDGLPPLAPITVTGADGSIWMASYDPYGAGCKSAKPDLQAMMLDVARAQLAANAASAAAGIPVSGEPILGKRDASALSSDTRRSKYRREELPPLQDPEKSPLPELSAEELDSFVFGLGPLTDTPLGDAPALEDSGAANICVLLYNNRSCVHSPSVSPLRWPPSLSFTCNSCVLIGYGPAFGASPPGSRALALRRQRTHDRDGRRSLSRGASGLV